MRFSRMKSSIFNERVAGTRNDCSAITGMGSTTLETPPKRQRAVARHATNRLQHRSPIRLQSSRQINTSAPRDTKRQSLNAIANDIGMAMRDVGLRCPVYATVRDPGIRWQRLRPRSIHRMTIGRVHRPSPAKSYRRGLVVADCVVGN